MTTYRLNDAAVRHARALIDAGDVDTTTSWSDAAPSAAQENDHIESNGLDAYGEWHLGVDPDASAETKGRYHFPYGDLVRVNRAALIHAKQRASQNGHDEIEKAADALLQRLDDAQG
jgi:hypothetical protein